MFTDVCEAQFAYHGKHVKHGQHVKHLMYDKHADQYLITL